MKRVRTAGEVNSTIDLGWQRKENLEKFVCFKNIFHPNANSKLLKICLFVFCKIKKNNLNSLPALAFLLLFPFAFTRLLLFLLFLVFLLPF